MGKHGYKKDCCPIQICDNIVFTLRAGEGTNAVPQVTTTLFFTKNCNVATLQWCTFGGVAESGQTSTTAQNYCVPSDARPPCDQVFAIAGTDNNSGDYRPMNIIVRTDGTVSFLFNLEESTNTFPTFNGSSVSWITFGCPTVCKMCC
jgi:hypothetical protein